MWAPLLLESSSLKDAEPSAPRVENLESISWKWGHNPWPTDGWPWLASVLWNVTLQMAVVSKPVRRTTPADVTQHSYSSADLGQIASDHLLATVRATPRVCARTPAAGGGGGHKVPLGRWLSTHIPYSPLTPGNPIHLQDGNSYQESTLSQ